VDTLCLNPSAAGARPPIKTRREHLAYFGGTPAFDAPLHVGSPSLGDRARLLERINTILDDRWFTNNGPLVQELEARVSEMLGVAHCIATCNATAALEICARAAGLTGEVIMPSFTFVATPHSIAWQGMTPVFCDVGPDDHLIDPAAIEALITPQTTGILAVHLWGDPCNVEALTAIADRHNLTLLFDASHAFGCSYHGVPIGNFGAAEVFSLHATKFVNAFEGGLITTNDDEFAAKARLMRNFGLAGDGSVVSIGINAKMSEVSAAMALTSLEAMHDVAELNRERYQLYRELLSPLPGLTIHEPRPDETNNYQYVVIEVDEAQASLSRDCLMKMLHAENVLVKRYFYPGCHRMEPYASSGRAHHLPRTEWLSSSVLALPTGAAVSLDAVATICSLIALSIEAHRKQPGRARALAIAS
jgi:dTDP-4-amino-4,6-dideoxygalactose transaminase